MAPQPKSKSRKDAEAEVRDWGFSHVFTWTDGPGARTSHLDLAPVVLAQGRPAREKMLTPADYPPHSHSGLTTHLILSGKLTITYLDDPVGSKSKTTYTVGDRIDVAAGRVHEVWMGEEGCTYVIGE